MKSKKYSLNKEDGQKILKVFGWTVASAVVVFLIDLTSQVDVPAQYLWLMPLVNTGLVALKKFIEEHK